MRVQQYRLNVYSLVSHIYYDDFRPQSSSVPTTEKTYRYNTAGIIRVLHPATGRW